MIPRNISPAELERLRKARWRGRTDLLWLCREVLGFRDVVEHVHGPIIRILTRFPKPPDDVLHKLDVVEPGVVQYVPALDPYSMPGKRRTLILDPRGGLKTSINCIAHTIQWILNFPHLAYLIVQANTQKAEDILREIKQHFQYNRVFREIYPDYCPQKHISDWGNRQEFDVPDTEGRARILELYSQYGYCAKTRKEHTCMIASIDKGTAGYHWDVMKFSDIVEENNTRTPDQMKQVIYTFNMMENLLVRPTSWIDVEGTRYASGDLYGRLIDAWESSEDFRRQWNVHVRSCWLRDFGGEEPRYTPDTLKLPFLRDSNGQLISWWPERMPAEELRRKAVQDPYVFATQQLNDPLGGEENRVFPLSMLKWIRREEFDKLPIAYYQTSIDTADTVGHNSNFSCITTCAFDRYGRCYVVHVVIRRMLPDELIDTIFTTYRRFRPVRVIIEETAYVRGLKPSIHRRMDTTGIRIPFLFIKRDTRTTKIERIQNTLQPWFRNGDIIFLDDLTEKDRILRELDRFPGWEDDFLDTLADQFQGREWFGHELAHIRTTAQASHSLAEIQRREMEKAFFPDENETLVAHWPLANRLGGP